MLAVPMMWLPLTAITLLATAAVSAATVQDQTPLGLNTTEQQQRTPEDGVQRKLHGRFLHITGSLEAVLPFVRGPEEDIC